MKTHCALAILAVVLAAGCGHSELPIGELTTDPDLTLPACPKGDMGTIPDGGYDCQADAGAQHVCRFNSDCPAPKACWNLTKTCVTLSQ